MHTENALPNPSNPAADQPPIFPVLLVACFGLIAIALSDFLATPSAQWGLLVGGLLLQASAGLAWALRVRWPQGGQWLVTMTVLSVVLSGEAWLQSPLLLFCLPLPLLVALAQHGLPVALVVGGLSTLILLATDATLSHAVALVAMWITLWFVAGMVRPLQATTAWSWQHYLRARQQLDAERDYKADLQQSLQDLLVANRQLDRLNERLAAMRLIAEDAQQAKAAFVAKVSHEFRTPLNMIIGLIDLVVQTPDLYGDHLAPALLEDLAIVQRNCTHLAGMIDDVLDLSQTQAGRLALHRAWVDLAQEVTHAVRVVQPLLDKKGLALHLQIEDELPPVYCDRTRIRQVVLNLVSNAARYTAQGEVSVRVKVLERAVLVEIADTGPGIAAQDLALIFEPFYQAATSPWQDRKGSGLGLSISKQLIELHHGTLTVESTVGRGSTFAFRLPFLPPQPPIAQAGRWLQADWLWHEQSAHRSLPALPDQQRVVLYDENGALSPLLATAAERLEVVVAADFAAAVTAAHVHPAHALLLNSSAATNLLPLMTAAKDALPDTPIFGYTLPPRLTPLAQTGAMHYLTKPVTRADLQGVLHAGAQPVARILLVDDDPDFRSLLARMLQSLDPTLTVEAAPDPQTALTILAERPPDLLFLDISMPQLDGWQLLRRKEALATANVTRVAIVSAQDPSSEPPSGDLLVAALGRSLAAEQLLAASLMLAQFFLQPVHRPDPTPQSILDAPPV